MKLKELREKKNITQTELARITQIPVRNYNHYENGITQPDIETLCKLADFYHTTIDDIVGRQTELINLNALAPVRAKLIRYIIQMNDLQEIKVEAYLDGLMEQ